MPPHSPSLEPAATKGNFMEIFLAATLLMRTPVRTRGSSGAYHARLLEGVSPSKANKMSTFEEIEG